MLRLAVAVEHEYGWQHKVGHKGFVLLAGA
jgi:hypothetical protein